MAFTVYTKSNCQQCVATKRLLDRRGVPYTTVDLDADASQIEVVKALGFTSAPVVTVTDGTRTIDSWGGYRPDKIKELASTN